MKTLQALIESDTSVKDIVYTAVKEPEPIEPSFTGSNYLKVLVRRVTAHCWFGTISYFKTSKPGKYSFGTQDVEDIAGKLTVPEGVSVGEYEFNSASRYTHVSTVPQVALGGDEMGLSMKRGNNGWSKGEV